MRRSLSAGLSLPHVFAHFARVGLPVGAVGGCGLVPLPLGSAESRGLVGLPVDDRGPNAPRPLGLLLLSGREQSLLPPRTAAPSDDATKQRVQHHLRNALAGSARGPLLRDDPRRLRQPHGQVECPREGNEPERRSDGRLRGSSAFSTFSPSTSPWCRCRTYIPATSPSVPRT